MRERPIIFSGEMVRAILEDRKTVTRRSVPNPVESALGLRGWRDRWNNLNAPGRNPYGQPGDRLWVRESFWPAFKPEGKSNGCVYRADYLQPTLLDPAVYHQKTWTPAIHMPRTACRLVLEVVDVRVERLQDIAEEDILREGVTVPGAPGLPTLHHAWAAVWDHFNGKKAPWETNPWVWRVEFRRLNA